MKRRKRSMMIKSDDRRKLFDRKLFGPNSATLPGIVHARNQNVARCAGNTGVRVAATPLRATVYAAPVTFVVAVGSGVVQSSLPTNRNRVIPG